MKSTHIMLLRHAETANPAVFHGAESDIGLSDKGMRQAAAIAAVLTRFEPAVVVSSAMRRALATAAPIAAACAVPHQVEPLLHERRVGILSGQPHSNAEGIWPETQRRWRAGETSYAHEGAESLDAIQARVMPVFQRVVAEHAESRLVIVVHGIVIRAMLLALFPHWGWDDVGPTYNVALNELRVEAGTWTAVRIGHKPEELVRDGLL
jgi:broad specificity phosphatase PhoE